MKNAVSFTHTFWHISRLKVCAENFSIFSNLDIRPTIHLFMSRKRDCLEGRLIEKTVKASPKPRIRF